MLLTWQSDKAPSREWEFTPRRLLTPEAEAIENVGGSVWDNFDEFARLFNAGNRRALRAALWIMLRREDPKIEFDSLNVGAYDIKVSFGDDEKSVIRDLLVSQPDMDPEQRETFIEWLGEDPAKNPKEELRSDLPQHQTESAPDVSPTAGP